MATGIFPEKTPRPDFPASDDPELVARLATASIEDVVNDILFEEIQAVGDAWRQVASTKRDLLDEETLQRVVDDVVEGAPTDSLNRADRRGGWQAQVLRDTKLSTQRMILVAQHSVTHRLFGEDEHLANAKEEFAQEQALYALGENDGQQPSDRWMTKVFVEAGNSYCYAISLENDVLQKFIRWVGNSPNRFAEFVEWANGDTAEPQGEHRPVFEMLARYEFDPRLQLIDVIIEHWADEPVRLQRPVTELLVDKLEPEAPGARLGTVEIEFEPEDIAWAGFIGVVLKQLGIDADNDLLKTAFADADFSELPTSIQRIIQEAHAQHLSNLRAAYLESLIPFKRPGRFLAFDVPDDPRSVAQSNRTSSKKRRRTPNRGGRTSQGQRAVAQAVEIEPVLPISDVFVAVKSHGNGYMLVDLVAPTQDEGGEDQQTTITEETRLTDRLYASDKVSGFLQRYRNDARLPEDVRKMLDSILKNPRGNGCTKLKNERISISHEDIPRSYPVWHLNPNKRGGLSIGEVGRKTRIYYAVIPGSAGEELVLLDVSHKNATDEYRAGDFVR
ncbi:hypothetical protein KC957_00905 [Candidatus Saccharibacteria bacterium]|nr:hypothetical protein [Candidatus Saccharibacteria bacterium]